MRLGLQANSSTMSWLQKKKVVSIIVLVFCVFLADNFLDKENNQRYSNIDQLHSSRTSGTMVTFEATVYKLLRDDLTGDKHQKMILKTGNKTLLLAHNIDIAPRVPVIKGDKLLIKGQYEWNEKGGLVHWTHRSNNSHPQGWIKFNNTKYQ